MPSRAYRECRKVGCTNLTKNGYCEEHMYIKVQHRAEWDKRYQQKRDDIREQEFYRTNGWKRMRTAALTRDNYLCQYCLDKKKITPATTVHHIVPIKKAWQLRLTLSNLISLCDKCHCNLDHSKL